MHWSNGLDSIKPPIPVLENATRFKLSLRCTGYSTKHPANKRGSLEERHSRCMSNAITIPTHSHGHLRYVTQSKVWTEVLQNDRLTSVLCHHSCQKEAVNEVNVKPCQAAEGRDEAERKAHEMDSASERGNDGAARCRGTAGREP
ncbi:unnamed protein product [Pleuronectes platessa]|uniref:Uncharacterized protein n=1 Tax=Pleuronectes platessa TaxID=8262 RepID=A0A9N7YCK5_PLEPL|nr:unnamed protein product [Pleuronectes platessa]